LGKNLFEKGKRDILRGYTNKANGGAIMGKGEILYT
jgi:hypothetical protein